MSAGAVCPQCAPIELWPMKLERGRLHRCCDCRGVWLERDAAISLFDGWPCRFEPPAPDGAQCGVCRSAMARVCFTGLAPMMVCGAHGVWIDRSARALLPASVQRKLRRRELADVLLGWFESGDGSVDGGSSECSDVSTDAGCDGGGASCGGCGGGGD